MSKKYDHVVSFLCNAPWAVLPETLEVITEIIRNRVNGLTLTAEEIQARIGSPKQRTPQGGQIAVLPLFGVISHRVSMMADMSGGTSTELFSQWFQAALNDPAVDAIVLDVDSPGGRTAGLEELHAEIMSARGVKKVVAVANSLMASAAYWISSAAEEIVATPSAFTGSIGVVTVHVSQAKALEAAGVDVEIIQAGKYKTEGNPYQPLDAEARARLQEMADAMYGRFVGNVAKGRGVSPGAVREDYGQGRVLDAKEAKEAGLVDRVATMPETLARLSTKRGLAMKTMAAEMSDEDAAKMAAVMAGELPPGVSITYSGTNEVAIETGTMVIAEQEDRENEAPEPKEYPRSRAKAIAAGKKRSAPRV